MRTYYVAGVPYSDELFHHGIKGQRWGIRRYQNEDGTLTDAGRKKYDKAYEYGHRAFQKDYNPDAQYRLSNIPKKSIKKQIDAIRGNASNKYEWNKLNRDTVFSWSKLNRYSKIARFFNTKSYRSAKKENSEMIKKRDEARRKIVETSFVQAYDLATRMNKKDRDAAMAYVYSVLGDRKGKDFITEIR